MDEMLEQEEGLQPKRRRRWLPWLIVLLVITGVAGGWWWRSPRKYRVAVRIPLTANEVRSLYGSSHVQLNLPFIYTDAGVLYEQDFSSADANGASTWVQRGWDGKVRARMHLPSHSETGCSPDGHIVAAFCPATPARLRTWRDGQLVGDASLPLPSDLLNALLNITVLNSGRVLLAFGKSSPDLSLFAVEGDSVIARGMYRSQTPSHDKWVRVRIAPDGSALLCGNRNRPSEYAGLAIDKQKISANFRYTMACSSSDLLFEGSVVVGPSGEIYGPSGQITGANSWIPLPRSPATSSYTLLADLPKTPGRDIEELFAITKVPCKVLAPATGDAWTFDYPGYPVRSRVAPGGRYVFVIGIVSPSPVLRWPLKKLEGFSSFRDRAKRWALPSAEGLLYERPGRLRARLSLGSKWFERQPSGGYSSPPEATMIDLTRENGWGISPDGNLLSYLSDRNGKGSSYVVVKWR